MPTKSEESDLRWDRMKARESQWKSSQRSPQSSTAKKLVDSTDLGSIGAHFDCASESESYPERIDDFTDETYPGCDSPRLRESILQGQPDSNSNSPKPAPTAYLGHGSYLPPLEVKEYQRQRSINKRRPLSVSTVDFAVDDHSPTLRRGAYVPSVKNPTLYNQSICTTHNGNRRRDDESVSLYSVPDYKGKLGKLNESEKK
ncbi:uncharacterized protein yc1106_07211 [Curvularia clavata]|uniref:Uncharacterized protein n=1 Tax=Curvularia clavata TaxID=95742 RepID=A0A9Q8ZD97_CURCL|nr:uncharacterized protein yc1106_07211 [Curvularia clavata]